MRMDKACQNSSEARKHLQRLASWYRIEIQAFLVKANIFSLFIGPRAATKGLKQSVFKETPSAGTMLEPSHTNIVE